MSAHVRIVLAGAALALVALPGGCAEPLPSYPWTGSDSALAIMAKRADEIQTIASPCTVYVQRRDGYSVSLDAATAAKIPGWLRVRAWKFGNAVLDLTVTPDGVWLLREQPDEAPTASSESGPERLGEAWSLFTGRFFDDPGLRVIDDGGERFTVERPLGRGGAKADCEIDRASLTARSYVVTDPSGEVRLRLSLERYRQFGGVVWPKRLVIEIPASPSGADHQSMSASRVVIAFDSPEFNQELPPTAFVPPKRAVRQP